MRDGTRVGVVVGGGRGGHREEGGTFKLAVSGHVEPHPRPARRAGGGLTITPLGCGGLVTRITPRRRESGRGSLVPTITRGSLVPTTSNKKSLFSRSRTKLCFGVGMARGVLTAAGAGGPPRGPGTSRPRGAGRRCRGRARRVTVSRGGSRRPRAPQGGDAEGGEESARRIEPISPADLRGREVAAKSPRALTSPQKGVSNSAS